MGEKEVGKESKETEVVEEKEAPRKAKLIIQEYKPVPPFPYRLKSMKREREDEEIMDTF